ncbi:DUF4360 domain-containing protein [Pleurocapsa sp. PCC 7319]|uniref:DUF4360 domain-containing protein n=1 Tax=Pleurocapsa sp. PCC 7319 TaxID=118161 RepID=UPI000348AC47|nr:DUF4360 domain-containing protein [Pleurocapsa sp. PCC 7319]
MLGINLIPTKALTKKPQKPSIKYEKAFSWNGCKVGGQLAGGDGRTLAIVLDDMSVADKERQLCFIAVPTTIPGNYLMQDVQILYQGTTENPGGAKTRLRRKYKFVSKSRKRINTEWVTSLFKSSNPLFQEQDEVAVIPKSCGWQGWLIIGIEAKASRKTSLIVDTADLNAGDVKIDIDTTPCS